MIVNELTSTCGTKYAEVTDQMTQLYSLQLSPQDINIMGYTVDGQ